MLKDLILAQSITNFYDRSPRRPTFRSRRKQYQFLDTSPHPSDIRRDGIYGSSPAVAYIRPRAGHAEPCCVGRSRTNTLTAR